MVVVGNSCLNKKAFKIRSLLNNLLVHSNASLIGGEVQKARLHPCFFMDVVRVKISE